MTADTERAEDTDTAKDTDTATVRDRNRFGDLR